MITILYGASLLRTITILDDAEDDVDKRGNIGDVHLAVAVHVAIGWVWRWSRIFSVLKDEQEVLPHRHRFITDFAASWYMEVATTVYWHIFEHSCIYIDGARAVTIHIGQPCASIKCRFS